MPDDVDVTTRENRVREALQQISQAWLAGNPDALTERFATDIVMVFPGFSGSSKGREALLAGFRDFCDNARIHAYEETDHQVNVAGGVAVATFRFDMVYERDGSRYHSTGRDFWVFEENRNRWLAVWRTMLDVAEEPAV
jgi:uncharacterized protein (TIGR02246 family)